MRPTSSSPNPFIPEPHRFPNRVAGLVSGMDSKPELPATVNSPSGGPIPSNNEDQAPDGTPMNTVDSENLAGPRLIPLRYRNQVFPPSITPSITEVPAHFDVSTFKTSGPFSLHTEYSSKVRRFSSPLLDGLAVLKPSQRKGVPELWTSKAWALEFAEFVFRGCEGKKPPTIIEVHPPFRSSVSGVEEFLDTYEVFEKAILAKYPDCQIVIENRAGTKHPHRFLVSDVDSILALGQALAARTLRLGIALDLPQVFTDLYGSKHAVGMEGASLLERLMPVRDQVHTIHLWGRSANGGAHTGSLDGLFDPATGAKQACLAGLHRLLDGGRPRFLVLEVSDKGGKLGSILDDLNKAGFQVEPER